MTSDLGRKDHLGQLAVTCRNFRKPTNYCQLAREGAAEGSQGNIGAIKFWGKFKLWTRKFWASIRRWSNGLEKEADPQINKQWGISSDTEQPWDKVGFPTPLSKRLIFSSVQFSRSVVSDSLRPHESQHARPPCPSPTPVYSNSCPLSQWCHPAISSSVISFFSCPNTYNLLLEYSPKIHMPSNTPTHLYFGWLKWLSSSWNPESPNWKFVSQPSQHFLEWLSL